MKHTCLVLAVLAAGCSSNGGSATTLTVFAASSLTSTFTSLGAQFEKAHPGTSVRFSFGASSTLAQQVLAGAPADVFASASSKNMAQAAGEVEEPATFATNVAEIATVRTSSVKSLADLTKPDVKVALCEPRVPCGVLATQVLEKAHLTVHPVTQGLDVKSTLGYVTSGAVDAAIVYATDVRAAGEKVRGVPIPAEVNASTAYEIAPVKASKNARLAREFEDFVLSSAGQRTLAAAGFTAPAAGLTAP